jgi:hypothetical protein
MMEAKTTIYKNIEFRSMLDVRWAAFFDRLAIKWSYEPELFKFACGLQYLPDFWLPDYQSFVEIKPVTDFEGFEKCAALAKERRLVVLCGQPLPHWLPCWVSSSRKELRRISRTCEWVICIRCHAPVLAASYKQRSGRYKWAEVLGPVGTDGKKCQHLIVRRSADFRGARDHVSAIAILRMMSALDAWKNAWQVSEPVVDFEAVARLLRALNEKPRPVRPGSG